jgi:hypothetical protein
MTSPDRPVSARQRGPRRLALRAVLAVTLVALGLAALRFVPGSPLAASASPSWVPPPAPAPAGQVTQTPPPEPTPTPTAEPLAVRPAKVTVRSQGWMAWAMLDQRTGEIYGSTKMAQTSTTASLVKAWIGADYLRRSAAAGRTPNATRMQQLRIMIRDSDNDAASALWTVVGEEASTKRMIKICDLTDSRANNNWSITRLSPRDVARLGACIADGRAAGPRWTTWLLKEMRLVRGVGDFGIRKAFPPAVAKTIAIKNGWVTRDDVGEYHVNCLAIGDDWTMGVMTRYPARLGYEYGANICTKVAAQLRTR